MAVIKCPKCEKKIPNNSKRCPHCGKLVKNEVMITSIVVLIIISSLFILLIVQSNSMTKEEKSIYDSIVKNRNDFKDPSSVKLISAKYCSENSSTITINAKNSYGGYGQEIYDVYKKNFLEEVDINDYEKDEMQKYLLRAKIYEESIKHFNEDCDSDDVFYLSDKSIAKINKKLGH